MFSLIIVIVSIALVVALAVATIYYGSSTYLESHVKATAATLANQGSQLRAAMQTYRHDHAGNFPSSLTELVPHYLKTLPVPPEQHASLTLGIPAAYAAGESAEWTMLNTTPHLIVDSVELPVCRAVNVQQAQTNAVIRGVDPDLAIQCFQNNSGYQSVIVVMPGAPIDVCTALAGVDAEASCTRGSLNESAVDTAGGSGGDGGTGGSGTGEEEPGGEEPAALLYGENAFIADTYSSWFFSPDAAKFSTLNLYGHVNSEARDGLRAAASAGSITVSMGGTTETLPFYYDYGYATAAKSTSFRVYVQDDGSFQFGAWGAPIHTPSPVSLTLSVDGKTVLSTAVQWSTTTCSAGGSSGTAGVDGIGGTGTGVAVYSGGTTTCTNFVAGSTGGGGDTGGGDLAEGGPLVAPPAATMAYGEDVFIANAFSSWYLGDSATSTLKLNGYLEGSQDLAGNEYWGKAAEDVWNGTWDPFTTTVTIGGITDSVRYSYDEGEGTWAVGVNNPDMKLWMDYMENFKLEMKGPVVYTKDPVLVRIIANGNVVVNTMVKWSTTTCPSGTGSGTAGIDGVGGAGTGVTVHNGGTTSCTNFYVP